MKRKRNKYSPEQIEFLRRAYQGLPVHRFTDAFNIFFGTTKTEGAIKSALNNHGITCGRAHRERIVRRLRIYTDEQAQWIKNNYFGRSIGELTDLFNARFGTAKTQRQIRTFVHNRHIVCGRTGRFEKGHRPWNTGTKGQGLTGPNRTSFKKGSIPPNRRRLWSERVDSRDGYILVKVPERNPYTGHSSRYKCKHVYLWEQTYGPVPSGMVVAFRDGDEKNIDPGNLMLLSRAELLRLNKYRYKEAPAAIKPSLLALARLEVGTFDRSGAMERYREKMSRQAFDLRVNRTRLKAKAIEIGRDYLVAGLSIEETAKKHGVSKDRVRQIVARITR